MFTCFIRYNVAPGKLGEFKEYAQAWIELIEEYGGTHHGYFIPGDSPNEYPDPTFSFPGLGERGPEDVAVALFSFADVESYDRYKLDVAQDDRCKAATAKFNAAPCFTGYERIFLTPLARRGRTSSSAQ